MKSRSDGLGVTLAFVVDTAFADRIHVAPVALALRMDVGVSIHFARTGEEELCPLPLGKLEKVERALCPDAHGFNGMGQVLRRVGRTCELHHPTHGPIDLV